MDELKKPFILYVCEPLSKELSDSLTTILNCLGANSQHIASIPSLFSFLSTVAIPIDLIVLDIALVEKHSPSFTVVEFISTIMLIEKFLGSSPAIAVAMDENTSLTTVKELFDSENIKGVVPRGRMFTFDEKFTAFKEMLEGHLHFPKKLIDKLHNSKKPPVSSTKEIKLTNRQSQISKLVCDRGISNKAIAKMLGISESTVKLHVSAILKKYGVRNRTQLAVCSNIAKNKTQTQ